MDQKKLSVKEFREHGYLQELNRKFLHPLGLALEVVLEKDGSERFGEVWDSRDDPEGMFYGPDMIDPEKARVIAQEAEFKAATRWEELGYVIQPVEEKEKKYIPVFVGKTSEGESITIYKHADREHELHILRPDGELWALSPSAAICTSFDIVDQVTRVRVVSPEWTGSARGSREDLIKAEAR